MSPEKRYNVLRTCLLLSVILTLWTLPKVLANPVQAQTQGDEGSRYKICFTASDSSGSQRTKCMHITVLGACTPATADVDVDGRVDILDASTVAFHYGEVQDPAHPQAYNPLGHSTVDFADASCIAFEYDQVTPV